MERQHYPRNYIANTDRKHDILALWKSCLPKRWSAGFTDTHEFMMPPHPHHEYSQKGSSPDLWEILFSFFFGTSEDPLLSFTVSSKSTHSLPIGPDLHMKWYPSFSSTLAPLSTHMPGSEEAGKAHNWSVSLGWKSVTKVSPPRSTQEWLQIQIYCKLKWKFCRANTKHFFFCMIQIRKKAQTCYSFC